MSWMTEHAPQVFGGLLFCMIVYMLVDQLINKKNSND